MDYALYRPKYIFGIDDNELDFLTMRGGIEWFNRRKLFSSRILTMMDTHFVEENIKIILNKFLFKKLDNCSNNLILWNNIRNDVNFIGFNTIFSCIFGDYLNRNDKIVKKYEKNLNATTTFAQISFIIYCIFGKNICKFIQSKYLVEYYQNELNLIVKNWYNNSIKKYNKNNLKTYIDFMINMIKNK